LGDDCILFQRVGASFPLAKTFLFPKVGRKKIFPLMFLLVAFQTIRLLLYNNRQNQFI
jgi:hypothetical protein